MRKLWLSALFCTLLIRSQDDPFVEKPYLQLGDRPKEGATEALTVLWQAASEDAKWQVQIADQAGKWRDAADPASDTVAVPGVPPHRVYRAELTGLKPGAEFQYRIRKDGRIVFEAKGTARKAPDQTYSFVAFGDCAAGTPDQRAVAYQAYLQHPDFLFIAGDIVYTRGKISEYRQKFYPVYNSDVASPDTGGPLMRSVLFLAAPPTLSG